MQPLRDRSIRQKITLVIVLISSTAVLVACAALFAFQAWSIKKNLTHQLAVTGEIVAGNVAEAARTGDAERAAQILAMLKAMPQIFCACLDLNDGSRLAHFGEDDDSKEIGSAPLDSGFRIEGSRVLLVQPVMHDGQRYGTLHLHADFHTLPAGLLQLYGGILALVLSASLLLAYLLSRRFQGFVTAPILRLAGTARLIADDKDYSLRAEESGKDEVGVLTAAFNQMLAQIQTQDEALQASQRYLRQQLQSLGREGAERKRAEAAQARLTAIIDSTPDFVGSADPTGRVLFLNPAARRMVGLEEAVDISSMKVSDFHPAWASRIVSTVGIPAAIHEGTWAGETALRHRDGREIRVSQVIIAHKSASGGLQYLSTVMRDITELKASDEALRLAEVKYRGLVEQLPAITYHAALGETCAWSYVSPQILPMLGFTPEEWLASDRLWFDHIHPEDRAIPIEAEALAMRTGSFLAEYRMFTRTGELRWFRDQALFVPTATGTERALYGVMMDITEAKVAESRLAELNRKLMDSSRMAGMAEVATGVLHNVGNVLNSVNVSANVIGDTVRASRVTQLGDVAALLAAQNGGLVGFLTTDPRGRLVPELLARLADAMRTEHATLAAETGTLVSHVGHIRDIVAMQQSLATVSGVSEKLAVSALVEDALKLQASSLAKHGIEVVREFASVPPAIVDRHKTLQILVNLIRNAKQAMGDKAGRLTLTIAAGEAGRVRIAVRDSGAGIAPENLTRIFGHGFTTKKAGHGFGLHSSANAAGEMGGTLTSHSDGPGTGATFTLELPGETGWHGK